jgi:hypothetical protein
VYGLENCLSEFLTLCHFFTHATHVTNLLYSPDIAVRFHHFNVEIEDIVRRLNHWFRHAPVEPIHLPECPVFFVSCSLISFVRQVDDVEARKKTKQRLLVKTIIEEMLSNRGIEPSENLFPRCASNSRQDKS